MLLWAQLHLWTGVQVPTIVQLSWRKAVNAPMTNTVRASNVMRSLAEHRERFRRFVHARIGSEVEADELLQQAWLRAAEHVGQLREPDKAEAWFYRVLRRGIADFRARSAREVKQVEQLAEDVAAAEPEEVAACACALGLLAAVRPEYRQLIERVDLNDERVIDVASALGITSNNATVRLHRARNSLREAVLAHCGASKECTECECE